MRYRIFDPTGNITALVESLVDVERQPETAAAVMLRHPKVEQVGFFRMAGPAQQDNAAADGTAASPVQAMLRMAGGEFCGNASMSAAALHVLIRDAEAREREKISDRRDAAEGKESGTGKEVAEVGKVSDGNPAAERVCLQVSGAAEPVEVELSPLYEAQSGSSGAFRASVHMPPAIGIEEREWKFGLLSGRLPLVRMEGISHILIGPDSVFSGLLRDRRSAEDAVRAWCREIRADGLGLMFLTPQEETEYSLTPLVYVPGSNTIFWENSCASGSSAAGMYLADRSGKTETFHFHEPGGTLLVKSGPAGRETWLAGRVRLLGTYEDLQLMP